MSGLTIDLRNHRYCFPDLRSLLAAASPDKAGDHLAGIAAESQEQRIAARLVLADLPLRRFLEELVVPYESDEISRLIIDTHDPVAFAPIAHLTVGEFREWLLSLDHGALDFAQVAPGVTPEMAAAVSKIMRNQDLIAAASRMQVISRFRTTIGLTGRMSSRLQPNHPTDDARAIAVSIADGLLMGCGDAVIGINPATDSVEDAYELLSMIDDLRLRYDIPTQSCVLTHVTNALELMARRAPVDLVFQSVAGTQKANSGFGIDLAILNEAFAAAQDLGRGGPGSNFMYFETGQGSALSSNAHHGVDQQTIEARAQAVARPFAPLLINSVVGFIGPEYLFDGRQIVRAGLEDHFTGKLLGLPMGMDICYTNHAEADQDDMDNLLVLLGTAGVSFIMGVPGADDVMLNYQSTSFHDILFARETLGLRPAPEFEDWLCEVGLTDQDGRLLDGEAGMARALLDRVVSHD